MKPLLRWLGLVLLALAALQLFFVLRIAAMAVIDPQSTAFQRSEVWALRHDLRWRQEWVPYGRISDHLKRAVIASEDDGFVNHDGVDWNAIERAWERNAKAEEQAAAKARAPKIRGGSTITQQLAKNLLLSGERTFVRKGQELGAGVFGAEAAARRYYGKSASQLSASEAARLAVMLPAPKRFEKAPGSAYLAGRTRTILARMGRAELP
jgi:monofunctional biosynthetic peptidoglycan transglycosylase